ncbi:type IV pilus biogenesis/stability protein PilW [Roseateles sp. BYS78W]|uniref:Type IV pilus biogenesis/stability protein PilW n=1 Tax=Pelomonas candidula TaxID=3299025 RepID=A0ABW7HJ47_9BURK
MSSDAKQQAQDLHEQAHALDGADDDEALRLYHEALQLDPARPSTLYNLGLIHKYRGEWVESREFNRRSVELQPDGEAANWNLAIAATALCDWATARAAWQRLGIKVAEGDGPIDDDFGTAPVRLNPDTHGEVVWGKRIDPVRVLIMNIPFPASGFRLGDIVLHDGAPTGTRTSGGREYDVFNVLELHAPSRMATFELDVEVGSPDAIEALDEMASGAHVYVEDWTSTVRMLCKACSEGTPHEHHDEDGGRDDSWAERRTLGAAAEDEATLRATLALWDAPGRRVIGLALALSPSTSN